MIHRYPLRYFFLIVIFNLFSGICLGNEKRFKKATADNDEVVKYKLYPKKKKIELGLPDLGIILNQSYVSTFLIHGNINYFWKEDWGFSIEASFALNSDKGERYCIERFYNDYLNSISSSCPAPGQDPLDPLYQVDDQGNLSPYKGANFGPAYVPIRELGMVLTGSAVWTPVYGKQIAFLSQTVYMDLFISMGGGISTSTYYPKQIILKNGNRSRGEAPPEEEISDVCNEDELPGVCPTDDASYLNYIGNAGRPEPEQQVTPTITLGIGQKFHFMNRFNLKAEIRNYTLLGTPNGFESFFSAWFGLGVRI